MKRQNNTNTQLTPRQNQLLRLIDACHRNHCFSPTISELANQLHISRSTVFEHIEELRKKGLVSTRKGKARSLTLTQKTRRLLSKLIDDSDFEGWGEAGIPLAGRVAAGVPLQAFENPEILSLSTAFGNSGDVFAVQVEGDSMIDEGIYDGDFAVCQKSSTAVNGQLVVAAVEDDNVTLKRFFKEPNRVRLEPANANYEPIYAKSCRIQGIVLGLLRKLS